MLCNLFFISSANLTGHDDEKVGLENFELLKVLGTGGKEAIVWFNLRRFLCNTCANPFRVLGAC